MTDHADTIRRIEEWMGSDNGFDYCCETAEENGLTYEVLRALLAERQQLQDRNELLEQAQSDVVAWREAEAEKVARLEAERRQAIDALDQVTRAGTVTEACRIASVAIEKLGEKPQ